MEVTAEEKPAEQQGARTKRYRRAELDEEEQDANVLLDDGDQ